MTTNPTTGALLDLLTALRDAEARDPDLTAEANQRRRAEARAAALDTARGVVDPAFNTAQDRAARAAAAALDAAGGQAGADRLTARRYAWDRAAMLLDAGRDLADVIAGADPLTAEAVAEYGATWLRAQTVRPSLDADPLGHHQFTEPDTAWVGPAVVRRLAEVAPDPAPYRAALAAAEDAERVGLHAEVLDGLAGPLGRIPGAVMNRLHKADPDLYAAMAG